MNATRCCAREELLVARVSEQRPSQVLPVPVAALEGLPGGRDSGSLTRRRLLAGGVAGFASVYGSRMLGFQEVFEAAAAQAAPSSQNCLVLLYLAGGNDGLQLALPGSGIAGDYNAYVVARSALHRGLGASTQSRVGSQPIPGCGNTLAWANTVVSTPGTGGVPGDNGSATWGFDTLYGNGLGGVGSDLAILPAVDYTPSSLSHFDSSDYWFAGNLSAMSTGWLGRWIDNNGTDANPLQAVSIDSALSKAIRTAQRPVCAIAPLQSGMAPELKFTMRTNAGYDSPPPSGSNADLNVEMDALAQNGAGNPTIARARTTYSLATDVAAAQATINQGNAPVSYPDATSTLQRSLQLAARILGANLGTRVITIHWGAFDTHGSQLTGQDPQLAELSRALGAFKADLAARGIEQKVATLAFSEFGRRVAENGGAGTDHGAGGFLLVSGSGVRGGLASQYPGCTSLDANGNLKVTTDFRSVYQAVLEEWLGGDLTGVLPNGPFPALQRYDGTNALFK